MQGFEKPPQQPVGVFQRCGNFGAVQAVVVLGVVHLADMDVEKARRAAADDFLSDGRYEHIEHRLAKPLRNIADFWPDFADKVRATRAAKGFQERGIRRFAPDFRNQRIDGAAAHAGPHHAACAHAGLPRGGKDGRPGDFIRIEIPGALAGLRQEALVVVYMRVHRPAAGGHGHMAGIGQRGKDGANPRGQRAALQEA